MKGSEISVRPTDLRRTKEYVIFFHTWIWGFLTGEIFLLFHRFFTIFLTFRFCASSLSHISEHENLLCYEEAEDLIDHKEATERLLRQIFLP